MPAAMLDFERPGFLILLPLALLFLWWGQRRSLTGWPRQQALWCHGIRTLIVVLLCLAVAGPRYLRSTLEPAVVFLKDISASISPEARTQADAFVAEASRDHENESAEVGFAARPRVAKAFGGKEASSAGTAWEEDATDTAAALEFASALLPSDRPGRIVLLSDGVSTSARSPLDVIGARPGVEIDTVHLPPSRQEDAAVVEVITPRQVREGEVFDLAATVTSSAEVADAAIRLYQNDLLVGEIRQRLAAGSNKVVFPNVQAEGRMALYELEVESPGDVVPQNNRKRVAVAQEARARTLIVDRKPLESEPLALALREAGMETEIRPPEGFPQDEQGLDAFDLVIFADVPAPSLSAAQMTMLETWVRNFGGGFLMVGGEDSFGAGGYFRTPVASMLPVKIEREEREETPVVALLVILDRSGSMTASAGSGTKMDLANEGAIFALDVLSSRDLFGLFAVDTRVQEVVPLGVVSDRQSVARRIAGITAGGGGIYVYTSLAEAFPRLREARAKIKHIILFSDAADAEEKTASSGGEGSALDLAAAMLASRITLSVVALGREEDQDTAFLRELAGQGGGRFYLTADATTLPRLFTMETMRAAGSSLREDAFSIRSQTAGDETAGIDWAAAPVLLGLNITTPRPGVEVMLASEKGEPLLVEWPYGLGQVGAFTSDAKARWATEWLAWPGFGKFWPQLARKLMRAGARNDLDVSVREDGDRLVIDVNALAEDGSFRDGLPVQVSVAAQGGGTQDVPALQIAPGSYRAEVRLPEANAALVAVGDGTGRPVTAAWSRDFPREYLTRTDGQPVLQALSEATGGVAGVKFEDVFRPARQGVWQRTSLAPWLLGIVLVLWPIDIWLRRREWKGGNSLPPFSQAN